MLFQAMRIVRFFILLFIFLFVIRQIFIVDNYSRRQVGMCEFLPDYEENKMPAKTSQEDVQSLRERCQDKDKLYWNSFLKAILGGAPGY